MKSGLNRQSGISLIEVLVTIVLISIALLGSASLQVLSKRSNYEAVQRTTAAHLAHDLLARMRANRTALDSYLPAGLLGDGTLGTEPALDCADDSVTCESSDVAAYELWQWEQQLDGAAESDTASGVASGGLMQPTACIIGPAGGVGGVYEVAIAWHGGIEHLNPEIHDCGIDTNKYGEDNEFRHVLVMRTFLDTE